MEPSAGHNVKPPNVKPKVQTFGHELSRPLNLDGHSVKPPKAKPKVQNQNNPSNLTTKSLPMIDFLMKKNRRPLDHSLGFHYCLTQTSFESPSPSSKSMHFKLRQLLDFGLSVKGPMIGENG